MIAFMLLVNILALILVLATGQLVYSTRQIFKQGSRLRRTIRFVILALVTYGILYSYTQMWVITIAVINRA